MLKLSAIILILCLLIIWSNFAQSVEAPLIKNEPLSNNEPKEKHQTCGDSIEDIVELRFIQIEQFISKVNQYGNCGYRLTHVVRVMLGSDDRLEQMSFSGILKKEENSQYEYAWFLATRPGEAQTLANNLAEKGFYFRESMSFVYGRCNTIAEKQKSENKDLGILSDIFNIKLGQMGSFFLFEKKVGNLKKNEYRILDARITGKKGELEANKKKMDDYIAKGFRPVDLWYIGEFNEHFVVMEKDESIKSEGDYIFVSSYYGMTKTLNEMAKKGYKLVLIGYAFALLNRIKVEPLHIEYDSFETYKDVSKKSRQWEGRNLSYVATGISGYFIDCDPFDGNWFFSIATEKTTDKNKDILFLVRNDFIDEYFKKNGLNPTKKNPLTKEQIQEMDIEFNNELNRLFKEGYQIVNYGIPNAEVIMFERPKD